ncbi:MAG TPA: pirin family protein [Spirochaetes bacterium]|nr:pirin family protein [Spirochaetota bacterium]
MSQVFSKHSAFETMEGEGARVKRLFPTQSLRNYDPFVLLDEFFVDSSAGFPTHPHRGFEAITYMLQGSFRHQDNMGNDTTVTDGGVQRFTAGRGMSHSEMPMAEGVNHGFQLWINLAKSLKQIDPDYQQVDAREIPIRESEGLIIRTVVGEGSPVRLKTAIQYQDITMSRGKEHIIPIKQGHVGFIYLFEGQLAINNEKCHPSEALFMDGSTEIKVHTEGDTARFLLLSGLPHHEPIKQWGPYVD